MANIQKAAKWMKEGKVVRRPESVGKCIAFKSSTSGFIHYYDFLTPEDKYPWTDMLTADDLLAEDWEVAGE